MEYVIVTDSRKRKEKLYMVDRSKQWRSFWSRSLIDVMKFSTLEAAQVVASKLKYNNPTVWSLHTAETHAYGRTGNGPDLLAMLQAKKHHIMDGNDWSEADGGSGCEP